MAKIIDLKGRRFGRLIALSRHSDPRPAPRWNCKCDCGNKTIVLGGALRSGATLSCGCYRDEQSRLRKITHGLSKHPLYSVHANMMLRCYDKRNEFYKDYGGRGIRVCKQWHDVSRFINEIEASIGPRPHNKEIDRRDNNGNYSLGNVRWVTRKRNCRNRRDTITVQYKGKTRKLISLLDKTSLDISYATLYRRVVLLRWPAEKALSEPVRVR